MLDILDELHALHRDVGVPDGADVVSVVVRRSYPADPADVWSALTDPDRIPRWFLPVTGDFREGGHFALEGNAAGDILTCTPPQLLRVTFGGPDSIVTLRVSVAGDDTVLELAHTVPLAMAGSGAGALWVGPGWDAMFLALAGHLAGEVPFDPADTSPAALAVGRTSVDLWNAVITRSGTATADEIDAATSMAAQQYADAGAT